MRSPGFGARPPPAAWTPNRNLAYRSELALWQDSVRTSPHSGRAWNNLGHAQELSGDTSAAVASYRPALTLDPEHVPATLNLQRLQWGCMDTR